MTVRRRGSALLVVLVLTTVASFTVLAVSRLMLLNDSSAGLAADQARAFAAATALLRDAEADVSGTWPDGRACGGIDATAGCRDRASGVFFPTTAAEMDALRDLLGADTGFPCRDGICLPVAAFAAKTDEVEKTLPALAARTPPTYASYGLFTGATVSEGGTQINPYLVSGKARYWVEVLDYAIGSAITSGGSLYQPDATRPYVFRITVFVEGRRPRTQVVLREIYVPSPASPPP